MPPAGLRRGGARNRADRITYQLREKDCRKLIDRSLDAWDVGWPLSRFVTIAWGKAGMDADKAVWATGAFIDAARAWLRRHGYPMPWIWVQETGEVFGQHAHICMFVPAELDELFRPMPRRWIKAILKGRYVRGAVLTKRIAGASSARINPAFYEAALLGRLHYMMKCAPAELERKLSMEGRGHKKWGQACRVVGKRAGTWQRVTAKTARGSLER